jgi:hypothetical protein
VSKLHPPEDYGELELRSHDDDEAAE